MENQTSNVVKEDTGNPYPLALQYFISHTWCIVVTIFSFTVGIFLAIVTPIPFFLLVPVISLALTFSKIFTILNSEFMERFAKKHDYSYIYDGDMSTVHGTIFSVGQSQLITNVISKLDDKYVSRIFNYQYTVGSGIVLQHISILFLRQLLMAFYHIW